MQKQSAVPSLYCPEVNLWESESRPRREVVKRAQSFREGPAGMREGWTEERVEMEDRRQKPSWSHMTQHFPSAKGRGDSPNTGTAERGGKQESEWADKW